MHLAVVSIFFFVLFVARIRSVAGLECYHCRQNVPSELITALNPVLEVLLPANGDSCLEEYDRALNTSNQVCADMSAYCAKISVKVNGTEGMIRTCLDPWLLKFENKSKCFGENSFSLGDTFKDIEACFCEQDLCNGSSSVRLTLATILAAVLTFIFSM